MAIRSTGKRSSGEGIWKQGEKKRLSDVLSDSLIA
jgi:hypothetical protein